MSGFKCANCGEPSGKYLHCKKCYDDMECDISMGETEEEDE